MKYVIKLYYIYNYNSCWQLLLLLCDMHYKDIYVCIYVYKRATDSDLTCSFMRKLLTR